MGQGRLIGSDDIRGVLAFAPLTAFPPRNVLVEWRHQAASRAQLQIELRKTDNE